MSETKLEPCPFCAGDNILLMSNPYFYIYCQKCGCRTSNFNMEFLAVEAWNRRAQNDKAEV